MDLVSHRYKALIASGEINEDPAQVKLVAEFDKLIDRLREKNLSRKSSPLGWLFGKRKAAQEPIQGLYIYGEVGRGKTMLMDLFFSCLPQGDKRRAHFNDFMNDVHDRINQHRQALNRGETKQNDPIPVVADALAKEAHILCFDEFTVTDIADAMILGRLFTALFDKGVTLIATSNVAPDNLYRNGLNRQLFVPFIAILKKQVEVYNLDAPTDYRLEKNGREPVYVSPLGNEAQKLMDAAWQNVIGDEKAEATEISVRGHLVEIPKATKDCARFEFFDLCSKPLAAFDYMALAAQYRTFFMDNVPILDDTRRNETKRFILFIDTLYDHHARLFISAAATADKLYEGRSNTTETFEFERTASRLFEMQSEEYLREWAEGDPRKKQKNEAE
ncbi:cell division protein ZapE [Bartonella sp. HY038]|uniref:cell division protein ZapE n=1 Tax=Bartonella sp. HY038 TaxID=2759660 RepID=UPI0015F90CFF|nr:cell division protein ZapE [Bartonella sp. HY038]